MVFTWTQYLREVAYYCKLVFSLHAIVCTARPPCNMASRLQAAHFQDRGDRGGGAQANHLQPTLLSTESNFLSNAFCPFPVRKEFIMKRNWSMGTSADEGSGSGSLPCKVNTLPIVPVWLIHGTDIQGKSMEQECDEPALRNTRKPNMVSTETKKM